MKYLTMSGHQIKNERNLRDYFSPTDLLRQQKLAAGFAANVTMPLSLADNFHSTQLYRVVFQDVPVLESPDDYLEDAEFIRTDKTAALVEDLWNEISPNEDSPESYAIFMILAAGYCLAQKTLKKLPITKEAAWSAYNREISPREDTGMSAAENGDIFLAAREKPYKLHIDPVKGMELLTAGGHITPRRLSAKAGWQGITGLKAILDITEDGKEDRQIRLAPDEYIYINYVDDTPVYVHPTQVSCEGTAISRKGDELFITSDVYGEKKLDCRGQGIISIAPDTGGGWLLLKDTGLDDSCYTGSTMNADFLWYEKNKESGIVEVQVLQSGALILLDASGIIASTHGDLMPADKHPVTSIDTAPDRKGAEKHDI